MKVLLINGSPHLNGNTSIALNEMAKIFDEEKVNYEILNIGSMDIRSCIDCQNCSKTGKCVFDDIVNVASEKFEEADGLVVGSPVYYAQPNANVIAFMQRLFHSSHFDKTMKVGCSVVAARRGGTTTSFDQLNKFFEISGMPIASGQYWNGIHGTKPGDAREDLEGLQMMRTLARNMVFLMKSIQLGKEKYGLPEKEKHFHTDFIRK